MTEILRRIRNQPTPQVPFTETFVLDILCRRKVADLLPLPPARRPLAVVSSSATFADALRVLADHNVLSAPVIDSSREHAVVGIIDVLDIAKCILKALANRKAIPSIDRTEFDSRQWENLEAPNEDVLLSVAAEIARIPVSSIMDMSGANPLCAVNTSTTLSDLIHLMKSGGLHRVVVLDHTGGRAAPIAIVSQSTLIEFMASKINTFGPLANYTVNDLRLGTQEVVTVAHSDRVVYALAMICARNISAVAVMRHRRLDANFSASDLRGLRQVTIGTLFMPITQYLQMYSLDSKRPPLSCTDTDRLDHVVLKLAASHVHRLWKTDYYNRPTGVVALGDIIELFSDWLVSWKQGEKTSVLEDLRG